MAGPRLVASDGELDLRPMTPADSMRQLKDTMRLVGRQAVTDLRDLIEQSASLAADVARMGEAVPPGTLEFARRVAGQAEADARTLTAILGRVPA